MQKPTLARSLALLAVSLVATSLHAQAKAASPRPAGPTIGNCPLLPADNVWNTRIDALPKDPKSADYINSIGPTSKLHPDFGVDPANGIPVNRNPPGTKWVKVNFLYRDDSDLGSYPISPDAVLEGGSQSTGDRHLLAIDPRRCMLMELYNAKALPDGTWSADSGIKVDLTSNALRDDDKTSADAAGLPILPGLVRYDEVASGEIRHALRFTVPHTQAEHLWPARHQASHNKDPNLPPMGLRLRLRADFDISGYSKTNQVILRALQRYGMFLADNGSAVFITGSPSPSWNDDDLHQLTKVTASDFEAVDESDWQMLRDSGRVDPLSQPAEK